MLPLVMHRPVMRLRVMHQRATVPRKYPDFMNLTPGGSADSIPLLIV